MRARRAPRADAFSSQGGYNDGHLPAASLAPRTEYP